MSNLMDDLRAGLTDLREAIRISLGMNKRVNDNIAKNDAAVQQFLADASPEMRFVQQIKIGGSPDFFYPVMFQFPDSQFGMGKLEIHRTYYWDKPHALGAKIVAGLLVVLEGNGFPWHGDGNILRVKTYRSRYNPTVSHVQFAGYAHRRSTDSNPPSYGIDGANYRYSSIYLRGGLTYRLSSNWKFDPLRLPDENDPNSERVLHTHQNTQFYVKPIPVSDLIEPVED